MSSLRTTQRKKRKLLLLEKVQARKAVDKNDRRWNNAKDSK